jgi:hypothetical protein
LLQILRCSAPTRNIRYLLLIADTYYLLPITYYLLPITYYLLPITHFNIETLFALL